MREARKRDKEADRAERAQDDAGDGIECRFIVRRRQMRQEGEESRRQRGRHDGLHQRCMEEIGRALRDQHQRPQTGADRGGRRQPQPAPDARQRIGRACRRREVEDDGPRVRLSGRNQQRRGEGADEAETGERGAMQGGGQDRGDRDEAERDKGGRWADKAIEAMRRVDGAEQGDRAGRRQHGRDLRRRARLFAAAQDLASGSEQRAEDQAEDCAGAGAEITLLDRITHQQ